MNIHLISHLADCVSNWGPLWAYSCFAYESMNGTLKKLFHGTCNMSKQVSVPSILIKRDIAMSTNGLIDFQLSTNVNTYTCRRSPIP